jgi:hypothetical protein
MHGYLETMIHADDVPDGTGQGPPPPSAMDPAEYAAKVAWLRNQPRPLGFRAREVERALRKLGPIGESPGSGGVWYVAIFHARPGAPLAGTVVHADRDCQHLARLDDHDVRPATDAEIVRLGVCLTCG